MKKMSFLKPRKPTLIFCMVDIGTYPYQIENAIKLTGVVFCTNYLKVKQCTREFCPAHYLNGRNCPTIIQLWFFLGSNEDGPFLFSWPFHYLDLSTQPNEPEKLLISNIHLLSPQKWFQFVHFNIEKVFPRRQPQICPGFLVISKIK